MTKLYGIPHNRVPEVWKDIEASIAACCKRGRDKYTKESILAALLDRFMQLWLVLDSEIRAICVTEIVQYPNKKYCRILIGTGKDRHDWRHHTDEIELWAVAQGCDGIESIMRSGWESHYRERGWKKTHIYMEKEFKREV